MAAVNVDQNAVGTVGGDGNLSTIPAALTDFSECGLLRQYYTSLRVHYSTARGAGQGEIVMDKRQVLVNVAEAMKMMTQEEIAEMAAFSEGMAFMARKRQAEQNAEQ